MKNKSKVQDALSRKHKKSGKGQQPGKKAVPSHGAGAVGTSVNKKAETPAVRIEQDTCAGRSLGDVDAWNRILASLILIAAVIFAYNNSFQSEFVLDDGANFVDIPTSRLTVVSFDSLRNLVVNAPLASRVIPNISFGLNYYVNGQDVWGYHLVNLVVHILCALILFSLFAKTLALYEGTRKSSPPLPIAGIAFFAALIWSLHPLQTNVVTYIVQRMTSMAGLLSNASLLAYLHARTFTGAAQKRLLIYLLSVLSWIAAMLCKETSIMLPVIVLAYEACFFTDRRIGLRGLIVPAAVICLIGIWFVLLYSNGNLLDLISRGYGNRDFTMGERLLTQGRVIFFYISLVLLPLPSRLNLNHDVVVSRSLLDPLQTLPSLAGIGLLVWLVYFFYRKHRLVSFAIFWFLVNLVVESTVIPLEMAFEHRLYVPSAMFILAGVYYSFRFVSVNSGQLVRFGWVAVALLLFWGTWERNKVWATNVSLWEDIAAKSPGLIRGYEGLCKAYSDAQLYQQAYDTGSRAAARGLGSEFLFNYQGVAALQLGWNQEAIRLFEQVISLDGPGGRGGKSGTEFTEFEYLYASLAKSYHDSGRFREAYQTCDKAMARDLQSVYLFHNCGFIYLKFSAMDKGMNMLERAVALYDEQVRQDPRLAVDYTGLENLYVNVGSFYIDRNMIQKAYDISAKGEQLGLASGQFYNIWGEAALKLNRVAESVELLEKAVQRDADNWSSHSNLAAAYQLAGRMSDAQREREIVSRLSGGQN